MPSTASYKSGLLLDTHVLVRHARFDHRLGRRARAAIEHALRDDTAFVAAVSFWEVGMLMGKGGLRLDISIRAFRKAVLQLGFREHAIDGHVACVMTELPAVHGDPADRLLVATAMSFGLTLLTADATLLEWGVPGLAVQDATE